MQIRAPQGYYDQEQNANSNKQLTQVLKSVLELQAGANIPKAEKDLIIAYAKDILATNYLDGLNLTPKMLADKDTRKELASVILAATAAAMNFEMELLKRELKTLLDKPVNTPGELKELKADLKKVLTKLNQFNPNLASRKEFDKMLNDDTFLEKLITMKNDLKLIKKSPKDKPINATPTMQESKELAETLQGLFGMDPRQPGQAIPVLVVVGNGLGIVDAFAAENSNEPIHRLSGDKNIYGIDEHVPVVDRLSNGIHSLHSLLTNSDAVDLIEDAAYKTSQTAPTLTRE